MKTGYIHRKSMNPCGLRFDSSYHLSDGVAVKRVIASSPYPLMPIEKAADRIFIGGRARRVYVKDREHGIPFLSSSDILQADLEAVKLASKKYTPNVEDMKLQKGWTLITRSGTIGNCAFANAKHAQKLASEHVIRLVPNNILREGYIYAYLASKQGYSLLTQGTFGAVIQHIEPAYVASLPIPVAPESFQQEVDDLIQESANNRKDAADLLAKAINIMELELSSKVLDKRYGSINSHNISNRFIRFDAQYQLGKESLRNSRNASIPFCKIGSYASKIFIGNRGKRYYVNKKGIPFLSSSDMMLANPVRFSKMISKNTPGIDDMIVQPGYILISRSGTVGNTILVGEALANCAVSEHAMRLVIDDSRIDPEYVFTYLLSKQGQQTLKLLPYGSVIVTLGEDFLADIDLPLIESETYNFIVQTIKSYVSLRDKAIALENKAISMVEQEIDSWNVRKEK